MGAVLNTVILRGDLSGDPTFRELLRRVRDVTLEAYTHQDVPFDKVVEALRPERSSNYSPFSGCCSTSTMRHSRVCKWEGRVVELTELIDNHSAKFDLNLIVIPLSEQRVGAAGEGRRRDQRQLGLQHRPVRRRHDSADDRALRDAAEAIAAGGGVGRPSVACRCSRRPSASGMLVAWNATASRLPAPRALHELFEARWRGRPCAGRCVFGDERLTIATSTPGPTSWRTTSANAASARRSWSRCARSVRRTGGGAPRPSSRPVAPTFRSRPSTRRGGSPSCWPTLAPPIVLTQARLRGAPAGVATSACSRSGRGSRRASPREPGAHRARLPGRRASPT